MQPLERGLGWLWHHISCWNMTCSALGTSGHGDTTLGVEGPGGEGPMSQVSAHGVDR